MNSLLSSEYSGPFSSVKVSLSVVNCDLGILNGRFQKHSMEDFRNSPEALNWHGSGSVTGSPALSLPPSLDGKSCICPAHLPICMVRSAVMSGTTVFVFKKPLFYLIMVPKPRSSNAINSDTPKRSYEVLPLSEKVSILHLLGNGKKKKKKKTVCWNCQDLW